MRNYYFCLSLIPAHNYYNVPLTANEGLIMIT